MNKLIALAWYWHVVILVTIGVLLFVAVQYTVTGDMYTQAQGLEDQVVLLKQKNEQARIVTQRIDEFRALFQAKNAEYDELKVLLPEAQEITNVLKGLQDTTRTSSLILRRFTPRKDVQQGFIAQKQVEVEVSSNYGNLRNFFSQMAKLQRIVSVSEVNIRQTPNQTANKTIDSRFLLTAYYATPETSQPAVPAPGAPPVPGQPAPAGQQPPAPNGQQPPPATPPTAPPPIR
jgi:type IV pilus assembly protein PilO